MELGRVEVGEANLDPLIRIGRSADAKAIPVANVPDRAGEPHAGLGWQRRFARICMRRSNRAEEGRCAGKKERSAAHAAAFNMLLPLLQQRAGELVPARHPGALLGHVVPAIVVLGADVLQRMVLEAVPNFLGDASFAGQSLERPP